MCYHLSNTWSFLNLISWQNNNKPVQKSDLSTSKLQWNKKKCLSENIGLHLFQVSVPPSSHAIFISRKYLCPCLAQVCVLEQVQ